MHIAASVGYFIENIMMHGTINIKFIIRHLASPYLWQFGANFFLLMSQTPISSYITWVRLRYSGGIWEHINDLKIHKKVQNFLPAV